MKVLLIILAVLALLLYLPVGVDVGYTGGQVLLRVRACGICGTEGVLGTSGIGGAAGISTIAGDLGISGTDGTLGISATDGDLGISGTDGTLGISATDGDAGISATDGATAWCICSTDSEGNSPSSSRRSSNGDVVTIVGPSISSSFSH